MNLIVTHDREFLPFLTQTCPEIFYTLCFYHKMKKNIFVANLTIKLVNKHE